MKLTLKVWRQKNGKTPGEFKTYQADHVSLICRSWRCLMWSIKILS